MFTSELIQFHEMLLKTAQKPWLTFHKISSISATNISKSTKALITFLRWHVSSTGELLPSMQFAFELFVH